MKFGRKDFQLAFKTGTDANKAKFKKECVQGEIYHATDTGFFYIAEVTAGLNDATLSKFGVTPFSNTKSLSFDGTNNKMTVGAGVNLTGSATVSLWFRRTGSVSGYGGALLVTNPVYKPGFNNTFAISLKNGTDLTLESYNSTPSSLPFSGTYTNPVSAGVVSTNTWYHLALVLNFTDSSTSSGQFYLNGNTVGSAIALSGRTLAGLNEGFSIASYFVNNSFNYFFPGEVDEVSFFNSALSASDISTLRGGASAGTLGVPGDIKSLSPVGWWRMGDGSDGSGNADGTLVNIDGTNFPQIYNVAEDGFGNRITGIDGSLTNIASPNGFVTDVPS